MINDPWFLLQFALALSGFVSVGLYAGFFLLQRSGKLRLPLSMERLIITVFVTLPLHGAWFVMPFLPQPLLSQVGNKGTFEMFAPSTAAWSDFSYLYTPEHYVLADWIRVAIGAIIVICAVYHILRFSREHAFITADGYATPKKLVMEGVYKRLRHPDLAAQFFATAGLTVMTGGLYTTMLLMLHALAVMLCMRVEERLVLLPRFGETFTHYRDHTPAFKCPLVSIGGLLVNVVLYAAFFIPNHLLPL